MILVTGATGTIGNEVVRLLALRGEPVRAMTRNPSRLSGHAGVFPVAGDYDDPASLVRAAAGASTLFLLSAPGPTLAAHDGSMLDAARSAGVAKVVKLSAVGTVERAGSWHRPGEHAVRASGMAWTILRPSGFASNALRWAAAIRAGTPVPNMTGAGAQGVVDPRDVAEVAVAALTGSEHDGHAYTLTGPELLSVPDQAACLAGVLGRPVGTVDVPIRVYREQLRAAGSDPSFADGVEFVRGGGNAVLTADVERVTGRPPRAFREWIVDHLDAFR